MLLPALGQRQKEKEVGPMKKRDEYNFKKLLEKFIMIFPIFWCKVNIVVDLHKANGYRPYS